MSENRIKTTWLGVPTTCVEGIFDECDNALVDWLPTAEELDIIGTEGLRLSVGDSWWLVASDHAEGCDGWQTISVYVDHAGYTQVTSRVSVGSGRPSESMQTMQRSALRIGLAIRMTLRHARAMAAEWSAQGVAMSDEIVVEEDGEVVASNSGDDLRAGPYVDGWWRVCVTDYECATVCLPPSTLAAWCRRVLWTIDGPPQGVTDGR